MSESPPGSPLTLLRAQLLVEKAKNKGKGWKKSASKTSKPAGQTEAEDVGSDKENEHDDNGISWAKDHSLTDKLLTIIEDHVCYRQAFGFKGGDVSGVTSGGLSIAWICRNIGEELFPKYSGVVDKLGTSIKNRVRNLKKSYSKYHGELGKTGHGLIMEEDWMMEIIPGTPISNVYEKMRVKFPWYRRLHLLLCASPVYDTSALANSTSQLDTGILSSKISSTIVCYSPEWDVTALDASFDDDNEQDTRTSLPSDDINTTYTATSFSLATPIATPFTPPFMPPSHLPTSETRATIASKLIKPKNAMQHVKDLTEIHHASRVEIERMKAESKRQRTALHSESLLAIEKLKAEDKEHQRHHELELLDRQILLAKIQAGSRQNMLDTSPSRATTFMSHNQAESSQLYTTFDKSVPSLEDLYDS
ncbi:hypothetical protein C0992_009942 [Termitomyces sp. T32_za158]|nr:hypothetical protein C0992_009942 [Termitomyces sp. T32_za158]